MTQQSLQKSMSVLQELDLGQHTLFIMSNGSIDLLTNDEETLYLADNGIRLDSDETYRLFISLHEQFQRNRKAGDARNA
ncbi:MAG TPA: hypothetical protein VFU49_22925 [Ktedonobacteraceae bacterium]|nr:hypothetical protein [Ktedonobacteraceae bacterium]